MTKLAVVSGGGTGIGAAIARGLIGDGYEVVVIGRRPGPLAEIEGAQAITADLREPGEAERVREALAGRPIDVLVNNAGSYVGRDGDGLVAVAAQWRANFDTNVITAVLLTEALMPQAVRWLAGPGGGYVTGQIIGVNGGSVLGR